MKLLLCFVISVLAFSLLCTGISVKDRERRDVSNLRYDLEALVEIENETYYFGVNAANLSTFSEAQQQCEDMGMTLISLQTEEKNKTIFEWIFQNPDYDRWYWSSGRYEYNTSSVWTWTSTGEEFNFTNWGPNQPDRQEFESCMNFAVWFGGWDDDNCYNVATAFICEDVTIV